MNVLKKNLLNFRRRTTVLMAVLAMASIFSLSHPAVAFFDSSATADCGGGEEVTCSSNQDGVGCSAQDSTKKNAGYCECRDLNNSGAVVNRAECDPPQK